MQREELLPLGSLTAVNAARGCANAQCMHIQRIEFGHGPPAGLKKYSVSPAFSTAMRTIPPHIWRSFVVLTRHACACGVCIDAVVVTNHGHLFRNYVACLTNRCMYEYAAASGPSVLRCRELRLATTLHLRLPRSFADRPVPLAHRGIAHAQVDPIRRQFQSSFLCRADAQGRGNMAGDLAMIGKAWSMFVLINIHLEFVA